MPPAQVVVRCPRCPRPLRLPTEEVVSPPEGKWLALIPLSGAVVALAYGVLAGGFLFGSNSRSPIANDARVDADIDDVSPKEEKQPSSPDVLPQTKLQRFLVSADGSRFAVVLADRAVVYSTKSLKALREATHSGAVDLSPDGTTLATADDKDVHLNPDKGKPKSLGLTRKPADAPTSLAFFAGGRAVAAVRAANDSHEVCSIDLATGATRDVRLPARTDVVAVSPDGRTLAAVFEKDKVVRLFDAASGTGFANLTGHAAPVTHVAFSPDGKTLASADSAGRVRLFDTTRCRETFALDAKAKSTHALAFSRDGKTLAVGAHDMATLHDVGSGARMLALPHDGPVVGVGFGPDGTLLSATSSAVLRWKLDKIPEWTKARPAPAAIDFDKKPPPEIPDLQPAGRVEPHLCRVIDAKSGTLLAFTRDKLCLRYSYPGLQLKGAHHVGAIVYRALLDADKGVVFAAVTEAGEMTASPGGIGGKGSLQVFNVAALLANKAAPSRIEPARTLDLAGGVLSLSFSNDGKRVVYVESNTGGPGTVGSFDRKSYKFDKEIELSFDPVAARPSPDGKSLYVIGRTWSASNGFLQSIDLTTFAAGKRVSLPTPPAALGVSESAVLTAGARDEELVLRDRKNLEQPTKGDWSGASGCRGIVVAAGRAYLLFPEDSRIEAYPVGTQVTRRGDGLKGAYLPARQDEVANAEATPDGKHLILSSGQLLRIGASELRRPTPDAPKEQPLVRGKLPLLGVWKDGHDSRVTAVAWSRGGKQFLSGDHFALVAREVATGKILRRTPTDAGVCAVCWPSDEAHYAAVTWATVWWVTASEPAASPLAGRPSTCGVALVADGTTLIVAQDKELHWAPANAKGSRGTVASPSPLTSLAGASNGRTLVAGCEDGQVRVFEYEWKRCTLKATLKGHAGEARCVSIGAEGKFAASGGADGKVRVWAIAAAKELHSLDHGAVVVAVAMTADGRHVASAGLDGSVKVWDSATGKELTSAPADPQTLACALAFSPDGKTLAVAAGATVRRYDTSVLPAEQLPKR